MKIRVWPGSPGNSQVLENLNSCADDFPMNVAQIRARLKRGFRPFAAVTSSGHKFPVPHTEFILVTDRLVIVADKDGYAVTLDPLHVVGLENLRPRRNGKSKRAN